MSSLRCFSSRYSTVLLLVVLEVQADLGAAAEVRIRVSGHSEGAASSRLPDVLLTIPGRSNSRGKTMVLVLVHAKHAVCTKPCGLF